ncbi:MAG: GNAT family N-acetyltransferase [Candidatus Hydrogenedentes bacterium]|nr:GNAT family N-acetyltransferase [Candidatus Hydrogenedentota bacterium]
MEFVRITSVDDPFFAKMHALMQRVFPADEVLEFDLWKGPLKDDGLRVCVAVHGGGVVGATEYRYYPDLNVAMTDFTIIGREGLGVGRYLYLKRKADLEQWARRYNKTPLGMFAEIYDPYRAEKYAFGGIKPMDPYVRREVLSHLGYKRLDFPYVHPSWTNAGGAVSELDLCFLPADDAMESLSAELIVAFLTGYYAVLANKPAEWHEMIEQLKGIQQVALLPL